MIFSSINNPIFKNIGINILIVTIQLPGLNKFNLEDDLILYRRTDDNYMASRTLGIVYDEPGFLSTSITNNGTLKGEYLYIIFAHKGVRGALVEVN